MSSLQTNSDRQVTMMTEQIQTLQNQLEYVSQLLRVTDRQEAEGQPASETTVPVSADISGVQQPKVLDKLRIILTFTVVS